MQNRGQIAGERSQPMKDDHLWFIVVEEAPSYGAKTSNPQVHSYGRIILKCEAEFIARSICKYGKSDSILA